MAPAASAPLITRYVHVSTGCMPPLGSLTRTLGSGAGLVAATAQGSGPPTWLVTGTDAAGVLAAASSLNAASLRDHFALATAGGQRLPVPQ